MANSLKRGDKGSAVHWLQRLLIEFGFLSEDDLENGGAENFGPKTEKATIQLQELLVFAGLLSREDFENGKGRFGPKTRAALKEWDALSETERASYKIDYQLAAMRSSGELSVGVNSVHDEILKAAQAEVGKGEIGGNNRGANVARYMDDTGVATQGLPWCAGFACYVMNKAVPGVVDPTASARALMRQFREANALESDDYVPKPGDAMFFSRGSDPKFGHVGIVERVENGIVYTIEGNTDTEKNGLDGVTRRSYAISDLKENKFLGFGNVSQMLASKDHDVKYYASNLPAMNGITQPSRT